ncbi:MAG: hypothetical protein RLZZ398_242 [Verrucomicrobiota bacterium]|jgi:hypothetical protein
MWIGSMSHSLALDDARLSEIRQDPCNKAVTDAGEFEPPPTALAASKSREQSAGDVFLGGFDSADGRVTYRCLQ